MDCDKDIGSFDIPVDDPFLMGVLNPLTDLLKELKAFVVVQTMHIAIFSYGDTLYVFHNKVGPSRFCRACIIDLCDRGVIHHGQRLSFGFKAGHDLFCVHPQLYDFYSHLSFNRCDLLGEVDNSHSSST